MKKIKWLVLLCLISFLGIHGSIYIFSTLLYKKGETYNPKDFNLGKDLTLKSKSGVDLRAKLIQQESIDNKKYIILLHGINSSMASMFSRAKFLYENGFNVLLIDFQAHGFSEGNQITFGYSESKDVDAAIEYVTKLKAEKIGVIATSMGGASFLFSRYKNKVDAVVLESVYSDIYYAIDNRIARFLNIGSKLLTPFFIQHLKLRLGISNTDLSPQESILKLEVPALIISGEKDRYTPPKEAYTLYNNNKKKSDREILIVKNTGHVNMHRYMKDEYQKIIIDYFSRKL